MGSDAPPERPEEILGAVDDADFGGMELHRRWFWAQSPAGAPWKEYSLCVWEGVLAGVKFAIDVDDAGPFPDMSAHTRRVLVSIASDMDGLRQRVAARMLELAKEWAASGDLAEPTLESLTAALKPSSISITQDWRPTVFFEEAGSDFEAMIFAGHWVEVRFDADGEIIESHLAG